MLFGTYIMEDEEDALEDDVAAETWGDEDSSEDQLKKKKKPKNQENLDNGVKSLLAGSKKWYSQMNSLTTQ